MSVADPCNVTSSALLAAHGLVEAALLVSPDVSLLCYAGDMGLEDRQIAMCLGTGTQTLLNT